jgi:hypothetical protein
VNESHAHYHMHNRFGVPSSLRRALPDFFPTILREAHYSQAKTEDVMAGLERQEIVPPTGTSKLRYAERNGSVKRFPVLPVS